MKPIHAAFSLCLLAAACASPTPDPEVSSAATTDMARAACSDDGLSCVTPVTRADAVAAEGRSGLGDAAFRWMLKFW